MEDIDKNIICSACKNYIGNMKCLAFDNIPDEILSGGNKHNKPLYKQKNNLIFEPIKK